jgi:hypothetical protein
MHKRALLLISLTLWLASLSAQEIMPVSEPIMPKLAGYHLGVVQIIFAANADGTTFLDKKHFYSIGFPMGMTLNTPGKAKIDLEFVPSIKPYVESDRPYEVHFLFHPGILFPLKNKWTFGMRMAFEVGDGQFGFTPLLNKAFKLGDHSDFFIELVAPGRFGPAKNAGYTQLGGIHLGFGF